MYKYDLHVHTSDISRCAKRTSEEIISDYAELGYDGVVITDHFDKGYMDSYGDIPWEEKVDCQLAGFYNAKEVGDRLGVKVFLGMELRIPVPEKVEILVFGLTVEFIKKHENFHLLSAKELYDLLVIKNNMTVFQAHPFRIGGALLNSRLVHGIEMINGGQPLEINEKAYTYAMDNKVPVIVASDNHNHGVDKCGIMTTEPIESVQELAEYLKKGSYDMFCGLSIPEGHVIWSYPRLHKTQRRYTKACMDSEDYIINS